MKIFGKWGWVWYRKRFKELDQNERILNRLKFKITVLEINGQISERYAKKVKLGCLSNIIRIKILREYLKERKER